MDKCAASLMLLVAAIGWSPFACHDGRLTAVLPVPDPVQRMVKRLDAYNPPLCNQPRYIVIITGILNPLSWADWLIRFWLVESGHVTTKRISRLMRWNLQVGKSQIPKRNPCMYWAYVDSAMRYYFLLCVSRNYSCFLVTVILIFLCYLVFTVHLHVLNCLLH